MYLIYTQENDKKEMYHSSFLVPILPEIIVSTEHYEEDLNRTYN
ncbi:hypothetical protein 162313505 [Organic Lake phycodnavirus 1]|jgi:hypothetical protein|nr:hypothetical protein 162313505 [Organic Lake phycodnavirus 1]